VHLRPVGVVGDIKRMSNLEKSNAWISFGLEFASRLVQMLGGGGSDQTSSSRKTGRKEPMATGIVIERGQKATKISKNLEGKKKVPHMKSRRTPKRAAAASHARASKIIRRSGSKSR
jgi:hypothetical protein